MRSQTAWAWLLLRAGQTPQMLSLHCCVLAAPSLIQDWLRSVLSMVACKALVVLHRPVPQVVSD
jgi:hypothetical protein